MANKSKNPLYVVTQNGKVVEEAHNQLDRFVKKFNLGPVLKLWEDLIAFLLSQVKSYPMLVVVQKMVDQWVLLLEKFLKDLAPFLFFYKA
ncbi:MAG: hypothetical protein A2X86_22225 [Bdellovibrionales bacterium GWA2_49_15]|nr:MAG: hypothetical protein A2X86_22225 [Bdellovibrionales bacterium GWA2_49_15]HAZ14804.1 hypothetical protein [Bdellovibrionales bacterium]